MSADKWTDAQLKKLEARIAREYAKAGKELGESFRKYQDGYVDDEGMFHNGYKQRWLKEYEAYQQGKYTDKQWQEWQVAQVARGEHWEKMKKQMCDRVANAHEIAQGYSNDILPSVYAKNSNEIAEIAQKSAMEQGVAGVRFDLVDEHTVKRLMEGAREVQPFKPIEINLPRINQWNMTKLQNALLQGILQGDSIDKIADRFEQVADMNRSQSIRSARTAVTGAQSAGKQDRFKDLEEKGCQFTKIWVATADERTRDEHREADGQEVDADEPFEVGGEELMYPGDPAGSPWNIYNCRCTMKTGQIRFKSVLGYNIQSDIELTSNDGLQSKPLFEAKSQMREKLEKSKISYKEVAKYDIIPSNEEIIEKLAGRDYTNGSCASLGFAYMGNLGGLNVADYRGGDSQKFFARYSNIKSILEQVGATPTVTKGYDQFEIGKKLLSQMEKNKEHCLFVGQHVAMVRDLGDGYEYLELQSAKKSGWRKFSSDIDYTLEHRFGCTHKTTIVGIKLEQTGMILDPDELKDNEEFRKILGYINTSGE